MKFNRKEYFLLNMYTFYAIPSRGEVCVLVLGGLTPLGKRKEGITGRELAVNGNERGKEAESWYPHLLYESHAPANEILVSKRTIIRPLTSQYEYKYFAKKLIKL